MLTDEERQTVHERERAVLARLVAGGVGIAPNHRPALTERRDCTMREPALALTDRVAISVTTGVTYGPQRGRLVFRLLALKTAGGGSCWFSEAITCDPQRTDKQLAADVNRRLLTDENLKAADKEVAAHDERLARGAQAIALTRALIAVFGYTPGSDNRWDSAEYAGTNQIRVYARGSNLPDLVISPDVSVRVDGARWYPRWDTPARGIEVMTRVLAVLAEFDSHRTEVAVQTLVRSIGE